ncbi:Hypothetical protein NTJ_01518 [Nesidiocoris tenuis]|uniref:Cation/H+ exchanger transmembrane domain-containing protein n=1 Tax=Nesidiocoris tenuis TaxID=355587 RepID=A0ABN7ACX8_9HEMI|nr:Hypothetical protein NTJ_01518 [Nesidiocoris tenuis]
MTLRDGNHGALEGDLTTSPHIVATNIARVDEDTVPSEPTPTSALSSSIQLNHDRVTHKEDRLTTKWLKQQGGVPNSPLVDAVYHVILVLMVWGLLASIFLSEALPGGNVFNIYVLLVLANIAGIISRLIRLPGLFGMLLVGIVLKSVGFYSLSGPYAEISSLAREFALAIILTKAGMALDPDVLRKNAFTVIKLSLLPCIGEAITAAVASHYIIGLPWLWAALMGLVMSPISPAVVVPTLISLKERGYGEDKGIATLVIAASAIDDVFSIVAFGVVLKMIFTSGEDIVTTIVSGPLDVIGGIIIGLVWALLCALLPNKDDINCIAKRISLVGVGGVALVLGTSALNHGVIGTLGCITTSLFANICWNMQEPDSSKNSKVPHVFTVIWRYTEPVLFAMVGAEIDVRTIQPSMVLYGLAVIAIGIVGRVLVCYLSLYGTGLNLKEVVFVIMAWLPKATVQAAISANALDLVRLNPNPPAEQLELATWILNTSILAIVITAPLGSISINLLGDKLLSRKIP